MTSGPSGAVGGVGKEFRGAELGDRRLVRRLVRVADTLALSPGESFPKAAKDDGQLEAIYRFLSNPEVTGKAILRAHVQELLMRVVGKREVLVVHDSSDFRFGGESEREGLGYLTQNGRGFIGHFSLCVEAGEVLRPLGVLQFEALNRKKQPKRRTRAQKTAESQKTPRAERESERWGRGAATSGELLARVGCEAIHVMDQEADDFTLFAELCAAGSRFVIRGTSGRALERGLKLQDVLSASRGKFFREIPVAARSKNRSAARKKAHPERAARQAELHVRTTQVELPRPQRASTETEVLSMNVVQVFEVGGPEGEEPIQWTLLTTEPIETATDITRVIDIYCARWLIEEFFKALKTGCAIERRQLESGHALLNALAIFSVIAWRLLALRTLSRAAPTTSADSLFSPDNIQMLRAIAIKRPRAALPPGAPTMRDMLLAIAGLGGHLKRNGDPGWIVLGRGYEDFLVAEVAWHAALTYARGEQRAGREM